MHVPPAIESDIRLKQAWACAQVNDCAICRHRRNCQKIDDKVVTGRATRKTRRHLTLRANGR